MLITSLISFFIPAFLVHRMDTSTYGAWVLILNLGAYVGYLDFGVQTAVAKFVAECEARGDAEGCGRSASGGFALMTGAACLGVAMTLGLAAFVPRLFAKMPPSLYHDVRISIVLVGLSLSLGLATSTFSAVFLGLQQYRVPATISVASRALYAVVLCVAVARHSSLATMGAAVALVNAAGAVAPVIAWRKLAGHVRVRLFPVERERLRTMASYCAVLTVWSLSMLMISGLDMTLVGHYAFHEVAFYSVATAPTNFMLVVIGSLLGPLLPATSALSTQRSPEQMGAVLLRSTRYAVTLLLLTGLPLMVGAYLLLRLWVGPVYAAQAAPLLRVLLLANVVRQLCAPYSTMVVATARQGVATVSAVGEGVVNLAASILLAQRYGAMGVALGTAIGAVTGIALHFTVSMHYTRNLQLPRVRLLLQGIVQPMTMAAPAALLGRLWWTRSVPSMGPWTWAALVLATVLLAALVGINGEDRERLRAYIAGQLQRQPS
jgi:O-antigen/teichoic acid export membrane protein